MTIDRLGPIDPPSQFNKANKASKPVKREKTDSISVSSEAKQAGEIFHATERIKNAPDIRQERVDEVKRKLQNPSYINDKVIEAVASKVMDLFDL
ncbi:MAG TPA: flagellar biosynthesis anti-sigma factor FlgM [Spirochaetia bacterium]|nr:flagellar biosynthesis anti-sigma factor FlgM [Spirochaetia bacterium]